MSEKISDVPAPVGVERKLSHSSASVNSLKKPQPADPVDKEQQIIQSELEKDEEEVERDRERRHAIYTKLRPFILAAVAGTILGWWISSTILKATRHRW